MCQEWRDCTHSERERKRSDTGDRVQFTGMSYADQLCYRAGEGELKFFLPLVVVVCSSGVGGDVMSNIPLQTRPIVHIVSFFFFLVLLLFTTVLFFQPIFLRSRRLQLVADLYGALSILLSKAGSRMISQSIPSMLMIAPSHSFVDTCLPCRLIKFSLSFSLHFHSLRVNLEQPIFSDWNWLCVCYFSRLPFGDSHVIGRVLRYLKGIWNGHIKRHLFVCGLHFSTAVEATARLYTDTL